MSEQQVIHWRGTEDQQHKARMKACRSRRKKHGQGDCPEKDGSCDECTYDMAVALRIKEDTNP